MISFSWEISTCDRIQRKNAQLTISPAWCDMCRTDVETIDHLLLHCQVSRKLRLKVIAEAGFVRGFLSSLLNIDGGKKKIVGFGSNGMTQVM